MSDPKDNIKRSIRKLADSGDNTLTTIVGTVVEGSIKESICDVQPLDGAVLKNVRLNAVTKEFAGLRVTPAEKSMVLVTLLSQTDAFISMFSKIEKVEFKEEKGCEVVIKDGDITINGGKNDGIVKVIELTKKINAIEKDINNLKNIFTGWVPVVFDGGAALKAATAAWFAKPIIETQQKEIENERIKH